MQQITEEYENLSDLLVESDSYLEELRSTLKDIKVPVSKLHPNIVDAIKNIFGDSYLDSQGNGFVTYDMYLKCLEIIKSAGDATADEFI